MTVDAFPSFRWFERFADILQDAADFKSYCRWFSAKVSFVADRQAVTVVFDRGLIPNVEPGFVSPDIAIIGTMADWDCLLNRDQTLLRLYRSGRMEIRGDNVRIMTHWRALYTICEGMKALASATV